MKAHAVEVHSIYMYILLLYVYSNNDSHLLDSSRENTTFCSKHDCVVIRMCVYVHTLVKVVLLPWQLLLGIRYHYMRLSTIITQGHYKWIQMYRKCRQKSVYFWTFGYCCMIVMSI